jgi:branched-chain amino acid transport system permease protein
MPSTGTLVVMIAFTMMAVGLNIVVGYCGLLDLGYVAFYAVGAYTAGLARVPALQRVTIHFGSSVDNDLVGHPHDDVDRPDRRRAPDDARRDHHRPPDPAPARRLPAIVTLGFGEIIPQVVRNGDSFGGFNLTNGTFGIAPIDPVGFPCSARSASRTTSRLRQPRALVLPRRASSPALHDLLLRPAARLAARAAWIAIREDETAAARWACR